MTTRFPAQKLSVTPLSQLEDYELVHEDQDVRGWEVRDHEGRLFGRVSDLMIDTKHDRVASLLLDDQSQLSVREVSIGDNVVLLDEKASVHVAPPSLVAGLAGLGTTSPLDVGESLAELDVAARIDELGTMAVAPRRPASLRPSRTAHAMPETSRAPGDPLGEISLASGVDAIGSGALRSVASPSPVVDADPLAEIRLALGVEQAGTQAVEEQGPGVQPPATRPAGLPAPRPQAVSAPFIDSSRGAAPALSSQVSEGAPFAEIAMALGVERAASEALGKPVQAPPNVLADTSPTVTSLTSAPMFFAVDSRREPSSFVLPEFEAVVVSERTDALSGMTVTTIDEVDVVPLPADAFNPSDYETHYREHFASTGLPFAQYVPAYGLVHELRVGPTLATHTWEQLEPEAHRVWESRHPGTWETFKAAVRHGWERLTR